MGLGELHTSDTSTITPKVSFFSFFLVQTHHQGAAVEGGGEEGRKEGPPNNDSQGDQFRRNLLQHPDPLGDSVRCGSPSSQSLLYRFEGYI